MTEVSLIGRLPVKARMRAMAIVEVEIPVDRYPGIGDAGVGVQIHLLVFDRFPDALDEDVVAPGALSVLADGDLVFDQHAGEGLAGELASLIAIEDLRLAVFGQGLIQRLDAEVGLQRDRHAVAEHPPRESVDNGNEIDKAARHRDIGDIGCPYLVGTFDLRPAQQVEIDLVSHRGF